MDPLKDLNQHTSLAFCQAFQSSWMEKDPQWLSTGCCHGYKQPTEKESSLRKRQLGNT